MAHIWFMHDAHLDCALFFLDMLAEYTLLSMTVMVTPCLWYVVGMNLVCPMSKFPQAPFARAPFDESRKYTTGCRRLHEATGPETMDSKLFFRNQDAFLSSPGYTGGGQGCFGGLSLP